jgi:hypothetical protein
MTFMGRSWSFSFRDKRQVLNIPSIRSRNVRVLADSVVAAAYRPDGARVSDISHAGPDIGRPMVNAGFADMRMSRLDGTLLQSL